MNKQRDTIVTQIINDLGVTVEVKTEQLVRCRDCNNAQYDDLFEQYWCNGKKVDQNHYCGYGRRKNSGKID